VRSGGSATASSTCKDSSAKGLLHMFMICFHQGSSAEGGCARTDSDRYLMAIRRSEGSRATRQALDDPSREKYPRYLRVHIDDESLVTDELVDYIHRAHNWCPSSSKRPAIGEAGARTTHQTSPACRHPYS